VAISGNSLETMLAALTGRLKQHAWASLQQAEARAAHPLALASHIQLVPIALLPYIKVHLLDAAPRAQQRVRVGNAYNAQPWPDSSVRLSVRPVVSPTPTAPPAQLHKRSPFLCCHTY
jgi:hypothetical protein